MLFCIAPAPVVPSAQLHLAAVQHCVEGALHDVGWTKKDLAAAMGFGTESRIGLFYRQLRTHGLNFNLLINAGPDFVLALLVHACLMLGIPKERIAKALGIPYETAEERQRKQREQEARDREIESRLRALEALAGLRTTDTDPPAEEADPHEKDLGARRAVRRRTVGDGSSQGHAAAETAAAETAAAADRSDRADLRALRLSVQERDAVPNPLVVRVGE